MARAYTIHEFAQTYKIGRTKIWQLIRDGQLKAFAVGSKKLIRTDNAEARFASLDAKPNKHAAKKSKPSGKTGLCLHRLSAQA